jgi:hypothetical protein
MRHEEFDAACDALLDDPRAMKLLSILARQVELVLSQGRPDLPLFLDSLTAESLVAEEDVSGLRAECGLQGVSQWERVFESFADMDHRRQIL